ncbi:HNH endonuclease signature motif containing protein [Microbacterium sp. 2FI]|uniref:HNH endonuclease signature motif containing protein n=1 Tax=Microbacterium sp. 2FI TaxID=2502193 RepID=UPI0010F68257|nr:HNH endonuclease signature motif containing protein [Microbacterium sp. 2FI]
MTKTATTPAEVAAARLAPVVAEVVEIRQQIATLQAREARALARADEIADEWADAEAAQSDAEFAHRSVAAELASALRVSDRTVQRQLADAERLVSGFPATTAALEAGRISLAHARVIVDAGDRITEPALIAEYESSILTYAEAESASRLRPVAKRRAQWFLNESIRERHAAAAATRATQVYDLDDSMAALNITGPAVLIHGIHDRITRMAREVADAEAQAIRNAREAVKVAEGAERAAAGTSAADPARTRADQAREHLDELVATRRSLDAIRVDLAADLLLAGDPVAHVGASHTNLGAIRATVQITVPVLTLIDSPVDDPFDAITLAGHGPIDPETARELTRTAPGWDRILTHPISGAVLAVDRYRPTKKMRRTLAVRDQHCRFPGCRQSTARSDLDHTIDWQSGGKTNVANLGHLCRRHHTLKHHTPWTVAQKAGGVLEWTSPTGAVYPDHPAAGVQFATDSEFDPAPF